jgi:hypothetical protein
VVRGKRLLVGLKVAVVELWEVTAPGTGVIPCFKVNVVVVIVKGSIGSLKVAVMFALTATPTSPAAGIVEITVGAVVSPVVPVSKVHT